MTFLIGKPSVNELALMVLLIIAMAVMILVYFIISDLSWKTGASVVFLLFLSKVLVDIGRYVDENNLA